VIAVFDEAHNVEDAAREHATRTCSERTFDSALDELADADDPRSEDAANVLSAFHRALVETYEDSFGFGDREGIGEGWEDVPIANEDRKDDLTLEFLQRYSGQGIDDDLEAAMKLGQELDEQYEEAYREGETATRTECQTLGPRPSSARGCRRVRRRGLPRSSPSPATPARTRSTAARNCTPVSRGR